MKPDEIFHTKDIATTEHATQLNISERCKSTGRFNYKTFVYNQMFKCLPKTMATLHLKLFTFCSKKTLNQHAKVSEQRVKC